MTPEQLLKLLNTYSPTQARKAGYKPRIPFFEPHAVNYAPSLARDSAGAIVYRTLTREEFERTINSSSESIPFSFREGIYFSDEKNPVATLGLHLPPILLEKTSWRVFILILL